MTTPTEFGISGERMKSQPWGRLGGHSGRSSRYYTIIDNQKTMAIFSKARGRVPAGGVLVIETAGGGGFGDPQTREVESCLTDWLDQRVSVEVLREDYGVSIVDGKPIRNSKQMQEEQ